MNPFAAPLRNRYLGLRHGESLANLAGIVLSDPAQGVPGYGLSPAGRTQVRRSVEAWPRLRGAVHILSSDFARARESAEVAGELLAATPRLRPELRERAFGAWEGGPNTAYPQVWARDVEDPGHAERGVESVRALQARLDGLIRELEAEHRGETFLLVSHGDPLQVLETAFLGLDPGSHRQREHWATGELRELRLGLRGADEGGDDE